MILNYLRLEERLIFKELEESLIKKQSDISVHSLKDVPVVLADGFKIIANSVRDDPRDVLISNKIINSNDKLRIGTSSLRRQYQLAKFILLLNLFQSEVIFIPNS